MSKQENSKIQHVARSVYPFVWDISKEGAPVNEYERWLNENIQLPEDCQIYRASSDKNPLPARIGSYHFTGTPDTVIVDRDYAADNNIAGNGNEGEEKSGKSRRQSSHCGFDNG